MVCKLEDLSVNPQHSSKEPGMGVYSSSMPSRDRQRQVGAESGLASQLSQIGKFLVQWEALSQGCRWRGNKEEGQHLEASTYISTQVCTPSAHVHRAHTYMDFVGIGKKHVLYINQNFLV